jgi:hypothetical protein
MQIPLSQNQFVTVDDQDHPTLSQHRWCFRSERSNRQGYAVRNAKVDGRYKLVYLHRQLINPPPGHEVIFLDHDHLNCRRSNLKVVTVREARHYHRVRADSESGIKGLSFCESSGRLHAQLRIDGKAVFLGSYETQEMAQQVYNKALKEHYRGLVPALESSTACPIPGPEAALAR